MTHSPENPGIGITDLGVAYVEWYEARTSRAEPDDLEAFSAGWHARDQEVADLQAELEDVRADFERYYRAAGGTL